MEVHFGSGELAVIGALLTATVGALSVIFKLLMKSKDDALADAKAERDNFKSVAVDANRVLQHALEELRNAKGTDPVKIMAPVRAEHQSPVTPKEATTAEQATLRAAVTAAALELGVPSRGGDIQISKTEAVAAVMALPEATPDVPPPTPTTVEGNPKPPEGN